MLNKAGNGKEVNLMYTALDLCYYCESTPGEVVAAGLAADEETALDWVKIKETNVLLCSDCRQKFAPGAPHDFLALFDGPIEFPPGVTAVEHCCPELEYAGHSEEEATSIMTLQRSGDYYEAKCPHCGVIVRSLADEAGDEG